MKSFLKYLIYTCLAIVPFLACYISTGGNFDVLNGWFGLSPMGGTFYPYITGKNFVFRGVIEIAFVAWALLALRDTAYRPRKSPLVVAVLAFTAVMFFAALFGVDPEKSFLSNFERMEGWVAIAHYAMYFVVLVSVVKTWEHWQKLLNVFVISNLVVVGYSLLQLMGAPNFFVAKYFPNVAASFAKLYPITQSAERLDATIGNSAYYALYAMFFIFLCGFLISKVQDRTMKYLYSIMIGLNMIALFYTQTRGTLIGLVLGGAVTLGVLAWKGEGNLRKYSAGVLVAGAIVIASIFVFKDSRIVQNSATLRRVSAISLNEMTSMSRLTIWKMSWEGFKERPILGYGQDNFQHVFAKHYVADKMYNQEPWFDRSHNVFFDWLIAGGIFGLLSYLAMYGTAIWLLIKKSGVGLWPKAIFLGLLVGYFVHNIFVFDNFTSYMLFFTALALIATLASKEDYLPTKNLNSYTIFLDPIIVVIGLVAFWNIVVLPYRANITAIPALSAPQLMQYYPAENVIKFHRETFEKSLAFGTFARHEIMMQYVQTTLSILNAFNQNPDLQKDYKAQGELVKTISRLKEIADNTRSEYWNDPVTLPLYGTVYMLANDKVTALALLERASSLAPDKQSVSLAYVRGLMMNDMSDKGNVLARKTFLDQPLFDEAKNMYESTAIASGNVLQYRDDVVASGGKYEITKEVAEQVASNGKYDEAIRMLVEYKKAKPSELASVDVIIRKVLIDKAKADAIAKASTTIIKK